MIIEAMHERAGEEAVRSLLAEVAKIIEARPFTPHRILKQGDAQTMGAFLWRARFRARDLTGDEERLFEVEPASQVLARCRWQPARTEHPTLVMWHGLEGSVTSAYMLSTADKAFNQGFNVLRVNLRNCGGTEHLTPTLYHAGLSADLRVVIEELIARDGLSQIFIAGFSLGGNLALKVGGEYGENPPAQIKAIGAVSPSIDLRAGCDLMNLPRNLIYRRDFLHFLKRRLRAKAKMYPNLYDSSGLNNIYTIEQFDDRYVAPAFGFEGVNDYYAKASSRPYIGRIRVPTLIVHAQDDPFIPFEPLTDPSIAANPYVLLVTPEHGGHVGFMSATPQNEDRFWAENRLIDFFEILSGRWREN